MATRVKSLLAVSWAMPPMLFPRSIQVSRALKALSTYGWQITVVCSDPQAVKDTDPSLAELYTNGYETICVPVADSNGQPSDLLMSQWLKPALKIVKKQLSSCKYSALITFAQPWVDHLIGLEARKVARIPWIAHFSDPWVDSPYYANAGVEQLRAWQKMERDVIRHADVVLFTNIQAVELVMRKFPPGWNLKAHVIPHAYDSELAETLNISSTQQSCLRMVYTGDLYRERSSRGILQALSVLAKMEPLEGKIEVRFVGRVASADHQLAHDLGLNSLVVFQDQIPYVQSLQVAAGADVLLLIDAPSSTSSPFLPSKLVDYLMFRKPILGLTSIEGASADLLRQLECMVVPPDDVPAITEALTNLLTAWRSGRLSISPHYMQVASRYDIREAGRLLDQMLVDVIANQTRRR